MSHEMYCQTFSVQNIMHYFKLSFLLPEILALNLSTSGADEWVVDSALPDLQQETVMQLGTGFLKGICICYFSSFPGWQRKALCQYAVVMRLAFPWWDLGISLCSELTLSLLPNLLLMSAWTDTELLLQQRLCICGNARIPCWFEHTFLELARCLSLL